MDMNFKKDYKSILGMFLFLVSVIIGIYMLVTPLDHVFIHIDELWSAALIKSSFMDCLRLTINDVHPPLYYFMVKSVCEVLNALNIRYEIIYVMHLVSILAYFGVLLVSATKIRKEYGWLTAGIFTFALATMSEFFFVFIKIRMQGWGLLFLLMSFVYLKDVMTKSDRKSWIMLILFTVLGCYTHYILLISYALIYMALLVYILKNSEKRKAELKKWIIASIATVILYMPWLFVLFRQVNETVNYSEVPIPSHHELFDYFAWITTSGTDSTAFALKILTVLVVLLIIAIFIRQYRNNSYDDNFYICSGFFVYAFTFALSIILLVSTYKSLNIRYLIPVISIIWLTFAIIIGKIEDKKLLSVTVLLILILVIGGMAYTSDSIATLNEVGHKEMKILDEMNSSDNVVVFSKEFMYICYHDYLTNTSMYSLQNFTNDYHVDDVKIVSELYPVIEKNPDKEVYVIKLNKYKNSKFDHNLTGDTFFSRGNTRFIKMT